MGVVFDSDSNLPGVFIEVMSDSSFGFDASQFGTTDSVAIIGTAFNGPTGIPTPIFSKDHAAYIFGGVYDAKKRHESSLVAGIYDAWDRGCRTIYAVRVGGKDMYKDFNFCVDNGYKLRLSARYPSNVGKDCYMRFDNTRGIEKIYFYKPAERATIIERKSGMVESTNSVLITEIGLGEDRGINYDTPIVDMINLFNTHQFNNVLTLSIIDENGTDVTQSPEAYKIPLGAMYPGVYYIGREKNSEYCSRITVNKFCVPGDGNLLPYTALAEDADTDVAQPIPIYYTKADKFREIIKPASITMIDDWDFLEQLEISERAWKKDSIDYEETGLTPFELYQRLGDGYAITARAIRRTKIDSEGNVVELSPQIRETPADDENRIQAIKDGIYSAIQNTNIKYRALVCATADQDIPGKLPRVKDFKKVAPIKTSILPYHAMEDGSLKIALGTETIELTPKLDSDAFETPIKYKVVLEEFEEPTEQDQLLDNKNIYRGEVFDYAVKMELDDFNNAVAKGVKFPVNSLIVVGSNVDDFVLYQVNSAGTPEEATEAYSEHTILIDSGLYAIPLSETAFDVSVDDYITNKVGTSYTYSLVTIGGVIYVMRNSDLQIIGDYASLVFDDQDEVEVSAVVINNPQPSYDIDGKIIADQEAAGLIKISSKIFTNITIGELVDIINSHKVLSKFFTAKLTSEGIEHRDDFVTVTNADLENGLPTYISENDEEVVFEDRETIWDYNLYIPYRTTDNFARQLAQHCTYTELKTAPAFGVIGCERMLNTSLTSVANKVTALVNADFDLFAKTDKGRYLLDYQNLAYPIGRNLNIVFDQHRITMENYNYNFVENGAAAYAGMVSTLPIDQSSTAQTINLTSIDIPLTEYQLSKLTAKGIVTFRESFTKGIVVTDGVTMAPSDSVYRRLNISRITGAVEEIIRAASEPFIGKQNHTANRNALTTAIKSNLNKIIGTLIENYSFTMNSDPNLLKMNVIEISYSIIPIYEIREIRNTIKITDNLTQ